MVRVAFRVDASGAIGTGHWRRCESLAHAVEAEGGEAVFIARRHDAVAPSLALATRSVHWLPAPRGPVPREGGPPHAAWLGTGWRQDAAETAKALASFSPDWIVADHYGLDARWHDAVAEATGARLAAVDDLADRPLAVQLLVDQNLHPDHRAKYAAALPTGARLLCGPRYALLSARYASLEAAPAGGEVRSIGIFMGGADPGDITSAALTAVRDAGFDGAVEVVSPTVSPHHVHRQALAARWPGTSVVADLPDLAAFFVRHGLQVGGGGGASWERCRAGAPTVAWCMADNQRSVLPALADLGVLDWVRPGPDPAVALRDAVEALLDDPSRRAAMGRCGRTLVDGFGSARVAAALTQAVRPRMILRPARAADEGLLLDWANEPAVRAQSFDSRPITADGHAVWFATRLADAARTNIFIAESPAGLPLGQVRFAERGGEWEVNYSVDASVRGVGLGRHLMEAAITVLHGERGAVPVVASVKLDNTASARVFESLGFRRIEVDRPAAVCHSFRLDPRPVGRSTVPRSTQ